METPVTVAHVRSCWGCRAISPDLTGAPNDELRKSVGKFPGDFSVSKAPSYYFAAIFVPANTAAHCNALLRVEVIHRV